MRLKDRWSEKMYLWHKSKVEKVHNPRMVKICPCGEFCSNCGMGIPEDIVEDILNRPGYVVYRRGE